MGGYLNLGNWRKRVWYPALDKPGLEHRPPYQLRHTFATLVASDPETSERELQAWLGHADLRTMERYRHYRPQKTAAQRIGRIFAAEQPGAATPSEDETTVEP